MRSIRDPSPAELLPGHLSAVDHEKRNAVVFLTVPGDPTAHQKVDDSEYSELIVLLQVTNRERTPHSLQGRTPILKPFVTDDHLSVMSAVTMDGELYTRVRERALTSLDSMSFLRHLLQAMACKLLVIWDGSPIHRKEVRRFMAEGACEHLRLERLPSYAPDLNPDEGVWQHLKHVELRNVSCQNLLQLRRELHLAIARLRSKLHLIGAFFAGAGLPL